MPHYAEFSEFSYGYALVDNAIHGGGWGSTVGAPRFLSLLEEGGFGGGHDIELPFRALPLFLQFKIPQIVRRRSNRIPAGFSTPYYRMHLRTEQINASGNTQHEQLLELEAKHPLCVYYVTPRFHRSDELDRYYLAQTTPENSEWYWPSAIGPLSRKSHRVAYSSSVASHFEVQSEPLQKSEGRYNFHDVGKFLTERLRTIRGDTLESWIERLKTELLEISTPPDADKQDLLAGWAPQLSHTSEYVSEVTGTGVKSALPKKPRKQRNLSAKIKRGLRELTFIASTRFDMHLAIALAPNPTRSSQRLTDDS